MAIKLFIQKDGEKPKELDFDGPVVLIGRGEENHLVIDDARSSRKHCSVSETPQGAILEDLGSSNGTRYKGKRVTRNLLKPGDKFEIGSTGFFFDRFSEEEADVLMEPEEFEAHLEVCAKKYLCQHVTFIWVLLIIISNVQTYHINNNKDPPPS